MTYRDMKISGNFVLVHAGELRLVFPQDQVGAVQYLEERPTQASESGFLRLSNDADARRYVALSSKMKPLSSCPADRYLVTTLGENDDLSWCWEELQILIGIELRPRPIPRVMVVPHTPVDLFVEHEGKLAFLCDARRVHDFALA